MATTTVAMPNHTDAGRNSALTTLAAIIQASPDKFLQPTIDLQQAALDAAKAVLDPLASNVSYAQTVRRNENRRKRKRGESEVEEPALQLRQVYTKGLQVKQVWEQARRVLDAACHEVEKQLELHHIEQDPATSTRGLEGVAFDEEEDDPSESDLPDGENGLAYEDEDTAEDDLEDQDIGDEDPDEAENIEDDSDILPEEGEDEVEEDAQPEIYVQDPNGLNDGFFSIDDFNKQSQFLEQMDARGDEDNPSDEDEVDWDADPLSQPLAMPRPGKEENAGIGNDEGDDDDDDDEEDGPTFGDADLNDSDDEDMADLDGEDLDGAMPGLNNTNDIRYADFFEPPPKKPSKTKRMRALPKTQPPPESKAARDTDTNDMQNDLERAMADVRRDLLDSEEEDFSEAEEEASDDDDGGITRKSSKNDKNLSTHEKQRAQIAAEIRRLETENVAKKDWTLSGEATAHARPLNSLIEEDLEFERTGKPVPVITAEVSEEIEDIIKRRILAREFDEVIRRRPDAIGAASDTRRGRVEVDDAKPTTGLGDIYEQEHLKATDPGSYVDKRSAATKKQHEQIDLLWKEVREQLDLLSNLHFKPKRVDVEVKTVEDRPRIAMEDARPSGGADDGGLLAPQEVYRPGTDSKADKGEVLNKGGVTVNKEEMSREEKLRKRRREKGRSKKAQGNREVVNLGAKTDGKKTKKEEKQNILDELKRGGVNVIGKGGELQSLSNKKKKKDKKGTTDTNAASFLKL